VEGLRFLYVLAGVAKRELMLSDNMFWGFADGTRSSIFPGHLDYYRDVDGDKYKGLGKNTESYFPRPYLDLSMNAKTRFHKPGIC
jgi:hypothetical protein